jgi:hypothetical protein
MNAASLYILRLVFDLITGGRFPCLVAYSRPAFRHPYFQPRYAGLPLPPNPPPNQHRQEFAPQTPKITAVAGYSAAPTNTAWSLRQAARSAAAQTPEITGAAGYSASLNHE